MLTCVTKQLRRPVSTVLASHLSGHDRHLTIQVSALEHSTHLVTDWQRQSADTHYTRAIGGGVQQGTLEVHLHGQHSTGLCNPASPE